MKRRAFLKMVGGMAGSEMLGIGPVLVSEAVAAGAGLSVPTGQGLLPEVLAWSVRGLPCR